MATTILNAQGDQELPVKPKMTEEEKARVAEVIQATKEVVDKSNADKAKVKEILNETKQLIKKLNKVEFPQIVKFELNFSWQWMLEIEGLDSFLVKKIVFPKYVRQDGADLRKALNERKKLTVYLHDTIAPASYQQVEEMILGTIMVPRTGALKYLSRGGTVVRTRLFSGIRVEEVEYDNLDYEQNKILEIKVVLSYEQEREI